MKEARGNREMEGPQVEKKVEERKEKKRGSW